MNRKADIEGCSRSSKRGNITLFCAQDSEMEELEDDSCFLPPGYVQFNVDAFRNEMISAHNSYRMLHGSKHLLFMPELEQSAQEWAETIAARGYLQYNDLTNIGENICALEISNGIPSGKEVVRLWYKEIKHYSFSEPGWRKGAFHFTQMIWKSTSHIGIGIAPVPEQPKLFMVVRYFPGGNSNMPGEFHKNVLPRISKPSESSQGIDDSFIQMFSGRLRSFVLEDAFV